MPYKTLQEFYRSEEWESFRARLISERANESGYIVCEHCGKPIVKRYDIIAHHKEELTEQNVRDCMVALNPANIALVHFKCHNAIHGRWQGGNGGWKPKPRKVLIVYGAPCAGKTTWVNDVATQDDLIIDIDSIWQCVTTAERYEKPARLKGAVFTVRDCLYDYVKHRGGKWQNAYVITGGAMRGDRERLAKLVGATGEVFVDATKEECLERCANRGMTEQQQQAWSEYINEWFARYQA